MNWIDDRGDEDSHLDQERYGILYVTKTNIQGGQRHPYPRRGKNGAENENGQ